MVHILAVHAGQQARQACPKAQNGPKALKAVPRLATTVGTLLAAGSAYADSIPLDRPLNFTQGAGLQAAVEAATVAPAAAAAKAAAAAPAVELPVDLASFLGENGLLLAGAAAVAVVLPLAIGAVTGGGGGAKAKAVPATRVLEALAASPSTVLVDIRSKTEAKAEGSPDLRSVKKSALALPLVALVKGEAVRDEQWGEKLAKRLGEDATVILLDSDGSAIAVAAKELAAAAPQLKQLYSVAGGAAGWRAAGAPWREPGKLVLPSVDLRSIGKGLDTLAEDFKEAPTLGKGLLGLAVIGGASFLLISQLEALLEVAGVIAAGQFALKMLFAEDREKTFTEIRTIVNDKVAIQDAGKDLQKIASTLLDEAVELQEGEQAAQAQLAAAAPAAATAAPIEA